jgi:hypothetical protein
MAARKQELQEVGGETGHKYFHMMLNMTDDDLDPFEYRLLGHYLRWAGHGGKQQEGIRQTAKVCQMSKNTVKKKRSSLVEKGYLKVEEPEPEKSKEGEATIITVIDRWPENVSRYAKSDPPPGSNLTHPAEIRVKSDPPPGSKVRHSEERSLEEPLSEEQNKKESLPEHAVKTDSTPLADLNGSDSSPTGDSDSESNQGQKSSPETEITHRQITDLIKAWWDALPELNRPLRAKPPRIYQIKAYLEDAKESIKRGMTPAKMTYYVKAITYQGQFWHNKVLHFSKAAEAAPGWCISNYRPPTEYATIDDGDIILPPGVLSADPEIDAMLKEFGKTLSDPERFAKTGASS